MTKRHVEHPWQVIVKAIRGYRLKLAVVTAGAFFMAAIEAAVLTSLLAAVQAVSREGPKVYTFNLRQFGELTLSAGTLLWICLSLAIFRLIVQFSAAYAGVVIALQYEVTQRMRLFDAYLNASWDCQSRERGGHIQILMTQHVHSAAKALHNTALTLSSLISFVFLLTSAFFVDWACALFAVGVAVSLFFILRPVSAWAQKHVRGRAASQASFVNVVTQMLAMIRELRIFHSFQVYRDDVAKHAKQACIHGMLHVLASQLVLMLHQFMSLILVLAGLAVVYALQISQVGTLGLVVLLLVRSLSYAQQLQTHYHSYREGLPHLEEFQQVEAEYLQNALPTGGKPMGPIESLEFRNVSFAYTPVERVLDDVSFRVERGEMIGIVGPSGSGKTTLMQLLLRLRDPQTGQYVVNGEPAEAFSTETWFRRMSFVPQESILYDESLRECIRFHRPEIDEAQIHRAAQDAGIHDDITAFPEGYDTPAGERGGKLSGGQRQRICIARALAGNPDVIVFDEPTSALDVHSEAVILEALSKLKGRVTSFIIAHRLSTLNMCDRVMVLRNGVVEAFDAPKVLAQNDAYYHEALKLAQVH
jgi:ATP-binding cassette subfamily B protein